MDAGIWVVLALVLLVVVVRAPQAVRIGFVLGVVVASALLITCGLYAATATVLSGGRTNAHVMGFVVGLAMLAIGLTGLMVGVRILTRARHGRPNLRRFVRRRPGRAPTSADRRRLHHR